MTREANTAPSGAAASAGVPPERQPVCPTEQNRAVASSARRDEGVCRAQATEEQRGDAQQIRGLATEGKPVGALGKHRDFNAFMLGQFFSSLGDATVLVILPLLVFETTGSVAQMGLVTAAMGGGQLVAGVLAGFLADRFDRRRIMFACDAGRSLVYLSIALMWWLELGSVTLLYVLAPLGGALGTCFIITQLTALPGLVHRSQLTAANGRLMASFGVALFVGPLVAGMLSARVGAASTTALNAVAFALSAALLLRVRLRPDRDAPETAVPATRDALAGVRFLWREPTLRAVALLMVASVLLVAGGNDLFIFHIKQNLGHGDRAVGAVFGIAALGAVAGGVLASLLRRVVGFGGAFLGMLFLQGVFMALMATTNTVYGVAMYAVVFAFGSSGSRIYSMTIRQELTPPALLGRVTSAFWILSTAVGPVGAAGATRLAEAIGTRGVLQWAGVATVCIAGIGLLTPARQPRPASTIQDSED